MRIMEAPLALKRFKECPVGFMLGLKVKEWSIRIMKIMLSSRVSLRVHESHGGPLGSCRDH